MRLHNKVAGFYKIERVINAGSALEYKEPIVDWFPNLILDTGMDIVGYASSGVSFFNGYCRIGSGNTTPAVTDLALQSQLAYTGTVQSILMGNSSSPLYYKWGRITYRFDAGVGTGNISEVGVGWGPDTSGTLFSRALILDGSLVPTTITKLADEVLDVTYEFRIYHSLTDFTGGFTLTGNKGASYTYTGRSAEVNSVMQSYSGAIYPLLYSNIYVSGYTGLIGTVTGIPAGTEYRVSAAPNTYVPGSYTLSGTVSWTISQGNDALGLRSIRIQGTQCDWQLELNTPIMKTSSDTLSLNINFSWSR